MRWVGRVERMGGRGEMRTGFWLGNLEGNRAFVEDIGIDGG